MDNYNLALGKSGLIISENKYVDMYHESHFPIKILLHPSPTKNPDQNDRGKLLIFSSERGARSPDLMIMNHAL